MPEIPSIGQSSIGSIKQVVTNGVLTSAEKARQDIATEPRRDSVELSEHARLLDRLHDVSGIREDVVSRVREEIENGTYETRERIDVTIDRLLEDLTA